MISSSSSSRSSPSTAPGLWNESGPSPRPSATNRATCSSQWSTSVATPHQFVLVEGFSGPESGEAHINSEHFKTAMTWLPEVIAKKPDILNEEAPVLPAGARWRK